VETVCRLQQHTLGLLLRGAPSKELRRCCGTRRAEALPCASTLSLLRVGFGFSFSVEGKGVATKATKSKGSEVPECVTLSLPVNSMVVFCTSPWKFHSQGGFLVPFPLSFCCLLLVRHGCFCRFTVDKMNSSLFLALQKEDDNEKRGEWS